MDITDIKIYSALFVTRNITEVAESVHLGQSTVSHRLARLQDELDRDLYHYRGGFSFTRYGEAFYRFCSSVLREYEELQRSLNAELGLTINLSAVADRLYLDAILSYCFDNDLRPSLRTTSSAEAVTALLEQKADIAVVGGVPFVLPEDVIAQVIRREKVILLFNDAVDPKQRPLPLVIDDPASGLHGEVKRYLQDQHITYEVVGEVGSYADKLELASKYPLAVFIPSSELERTQLPESTHFDTEISFLRDISVLYRKDRKDTSVIEAIIEMLHSLPGSMQNNHFH
ncbi:MAG: LysR family transcriptional regulator [Spirochaetales bacterium]|nr:LysR family transcriptional regulator [Spirochaetales bacterium]MCF7937753.1 LysR family transcriptional regulator [Spirochaetales bacterium]